jgi:putative sigma-54 modulation protein
MQIDIQARGFDLTDGIREHTKKRLGFAIDWAQDDVREIKIRLSDVNGPRGGEDKRCLIQIPMIGKSSIVIEDVESDLYSAIDKAIHRMERVLAKRLERAREFPHETPRKKQALQTEQSDDEQEQFVQTSH